MQHLHNFGRKKIGKKEKVIRSTCSFCLSSHHERLKHFFFIYKMFCQCTREQKKRKKKHVKHLPVLLSITIFTSSPFLYCNRQTFEAISTIFLPESVTLHCQQHKIINFKQTPGDRKTVLLKPI